MAADDVEEGRMKPAIDLFQHLPKLCSKITYPSKQDAKLALRMLGTIRRHQASAKCEDHAYHCQQCGQWHLTGMSHESYNRLRQRLAPRPHGLRIQHQGVFIR
jgi:hypothetical protein